MMREAGPCRLAPAPHSAGAALPPGGFEPGARCLERLSLLQGVQASARTAQLWSAIAVC